jgi:hypothetical protein
MGASGGPARLPKRATTALRPRSRPPHRSRPLGRLGVGTVHARAADVVLPGLELLATFRALRELGAVPALLAAASNVWRGSVVHLQAVKRRGQATR